MGSDRSVIAKANRPDAPASLPSRRPSGRVRLGRRQDGADAALPARGRVGRVLAALALCGAAWLALAAAPLHAQTVHLVKETFGAAQQPVFESAGAVTIDHTTGEVLVVDRGRPPVALHPSGVKRFKANGEPSPFSALGTNVIDGAAGPGGKSCAEEPASCDRTPENGFDTGFSTLGSPPDVGVVVDESGAPTGGDIYVTQHGVSKITVFAGDGHYLGQLNKAGAKSIKGPSGLAVAPDGTLYIVSGESHELIKCQPTSNPITGGSCETLTTSETFTGSGTTSEPVQIALGTGPSGGSLIVTRRSGSVPRFAGGSFVLDATTGQPRYAIEAGLISEEIFAPTVDPTSGDLYLIHEQSFAEHVLKQWDVSGATAATLLSTTRVDPEADGLAVDAAGDIYVMSTNHVTVLSKATVTLPDVVTAAAAEITPTRATLKGTVNPQGAPVDQCFFEYGATTISEKVAPCAESEAELGSGTGAIQVHAPVSGLAPNGGPEYNFRLVAGNAHGTTEQEGAVGGSVMSFRTTDIAVTEPAGDVMPAAATLNGTVNPDGGAVTECLFEYGESTAYGHIAPCAESQGEIGTGSSPVPVHADVSGLTPGAADHFRLVAAAGGSQGQGEDSSFMTHLIGTTPATGVTSDAATLTGEVDPNGHLVTTCLFEYGETKAYGQTVPCAESEGEIGTGSSPVAVRAAISGLTTGTAYHFRIVAGASGATESGIDEVLRTLGPNVEGSWAEEVASRQATVKAQINPGGATTLFRVEYGINGFEHTTALSQPIGADTTTHVVSATLTELTPAESYRYRFIASSACEPGEPEKTCDYTGPENLLTTTAATLESSSTCANAALRTGASSRLPDCRAYEMVSPVDKNGGEVQVLNCICAGRPGRLDQAAASGERFAFSAWRSFADAESAHGESEYISVRHEGEGWATANVSAPQEGPDRLYPSFDPQYKVLSEDLCTGWMIDGTELRLTSDALQGWMNAYRRNLCTDGGYQALTTVTPTGVKKNIASSEAGSNAFLPRVEGVAADGSETLLDAGGKLTSDGSVAPQLYAIAGGQTQLVCYLPSGIPDSGPCDLGSANAAEEEHNLDGEVYRAVSADGSHVFWNGGTSGLYVRLNPLRPQSALADGGAVGTGTLAAGSNAITAAQASRGEFAVGQQVAGSGIPAGATIVSIVGGTLNLSTAATSAISGDPLETYSECVEPENACTLPIVPGPLTGSAVRYWLASTTGEAAVFSVGGVLYRYEQSDHEAKRIAGGLIDGPLGASEDTSRLYFASTEDLSAEPNAEGATAVTGRPNLYLYDATRAEGSQFTFIGIESGEGLLSPLGPLNDGTPYDLGARLSPDGLHAVFDSKARLTGYDNTDRVSGLADTEVYAYDASGGGPGSLSCISCLASGARPSGVEHGIPAEPSWFAAEVPGWEYQDQPTRALSDDGKRIFFDSYGPLVPRDTDGSEDVYEWEPGATQAQCESEGAEVHLQREGGCLSLISSGDSPENSRFVDASADGRDVFFQTDASLVVEDIGQSDMYDAREGGGFAPLPGTPAACEGEACQGLPAPAARLTPASAIFTPGSLFPPVTTSPVTKPKPSTLSPAKKLANALKACRKEKAKARRRTCEKTARKKYRVKQKAKGKSAAPKAHNRSR
jgi:hypothetical protein